jgi:hypothetical protein
MVDSSQISNEDIQIVMKIEEYCNMLDNKSIQAEEIQNMNRVLSEFSNFQNFPYLKMLLYQSSSQKAKFYAANSLINLVTQNYITVTLEDKEEIYTSVLEYIVKILIFILKFKYFFSKVTVKLCFSKLDIY